MQILRATKTNINKAVEVIKNGGLVAFPTETVYGLGADGLNPIAVAKIFEAKNRPTFNPLILHISSPEYLDKIAQINNDKVNLLIEKFWPGPLTLVMPKKDIVPKIVTAGNDTVAVRMPNNKVALELIDRCEVPIAAPSANVFGRLSPTTASHVSEQLGEKVNIILDGGKTTIGLESTIIKVNDEGFVLLRHGGIPIEEIQKVVGKINQKVNENNNPQSPGQLPFHYSPCIPIYFIDEVNESKLKNKKLGGLFFSKDKTNFHFSTIKILSPTGNYYEAAANLFLYLHELESSNIDLILAEKIPEENLGKAIMDRLKRSVNKYK